MCGFQLYHSVARRPPTCACVRHHPPSFYLFVKEMCYKRIKLYDDIQNEVSSSSVLRLPFEDCRRRVMQRFEDVVGNRSFGGGESN